MTRPSCGKICLPLICASALLGPAQLRADTNLFGWWPLNEGAGNIAADISGNGRDLVIVRGDTGGLAADGAAWIDDPECGMVLSFNGDDGTGAYAIMTDGIPGQYGALPLFTLDAENTFTWSLWIKAEDNQANNDIILGNRVAPGGSSDWPSGREFIKFDSNNFEFDTNNVQGVNYADIVGEQLDRWVHHAIVKEGASFTYYRDGVEAGTGSAGGSQTNQQPLFFGGQGDFDGTFTLELWRGSMFDVRLFSSALSADDILTIFGNKGVFTGQAVLEFTAIEVDANNNVTLTWRSKSNASYALDFSTALKIASEPGGWAEIADVIDGADNSDTTTFVMSSTSFPFLNTESRVFFRVRETE
ncbi:MAG: LamG domain-containing protein [Verrucomicrobiales bacterium]